VPLSIISQFHFISLFTNKYQTKKGQIRHHLKAVDSYRT
jgi:hypothetical protein